MADMKGPGRIDAAELDLQPLGPTNVTRAVPASTRRHVGDEPAEPAVGEPEVHVTVVGLGAGSALRNSDRLGNADCDRLGVLAKLPGQLQAGRARVVATAGEFRPPQLEVRDIALDAEPSDRIDQRLLDLVAHPAWHH